MADDQDADDVALKFAIVALNDVAGALAQSFGLTESHGALALLSQAYTHALAEAAGPDSTPGQRHGLVRIAQRMLEREFEDVFAASRPTLWSVN